MFITLEGIEGAGKSTLQQMLGAYCENRGEMPLLTREPGGSRMGRKLRSFLLDARNEDISPQSELFLFLADRSQHIEEVIKPALEAGQTVLCDRYIDSTLAYQGYGRGMNIDELANINYFSSDGILPDCTLLLDLPPHLGLLRAGERNRQYGTVISEGRFDSESLEFHERVRNGYLQIARDNPGRVFVIDATPGPDEVLASAIAALRKAMEK